MVCARIGSCEFGAYDRAGDRPKIVCARACAVAVKAKHKLSR
jgi:hypothetical protein